MKKSFEIFGWGIVFLIFYIFILKDIEKSQSFLELAKHLLSPAIGLILGYQFYKLIKRIGEEK
jgi:hypothetical protein